MAFNEALFLQKQSRAEAEGRRMSIYEAEEAGIPREDYHKIYGSPAPGAYEALQQEYESRGLPIPVQKLMEIGSSPAQVAQARGLPAAASFDELQTMEAQQLNRATGIAVSGTRGAGSSIGAAREINPYILEEAPEFEAGQFNDVALANDIKIGEIERAQASQIDPTSQIEQVDLGSAAVVDPETAYREKQLGLASALENAVAGRGASLAELQLQEATDRNNAQAQGLIASQRGVSAGLATRLAANQAGEANQAAAREAAKLRMAEAIQARQELAGLTAQGRAQDFQIDAVNADAQNEFARQQGQLDAAVRSANAAALNQRALQQAQLTQQSNQVNAAASNARQSENADLAARIEFANALAKNTQNFQQAQLNQAANQGNAQIKQQQQIQRGNFVQNANLANQDAVNQQEISRGQTAAGIESARTGAGAQVAAAGASAGAAVRSAQIRAEADILNNTTNALVSLGGQQLSGGSAYDQTTQNAYNQSSQNDAAIVGGALGAGGSAGAAGIAAASDEKLKKNKESADNEIEKFLSTLKAKNYEYKNKKYGTGKKLGVMAQDLEKSPIGRTMVDETPDGKMVDFGKGLGAMLASLASVNARLEKLEKKA